MNNPYKEKIIKWQETKNSYIQQEDGWLSLIDLHWLMEGSHSIGSGTNNDIVLPKNTCPVNIGTISYTNNEVTISIQDKTTLINDIHSTEATVLSPDNSGSPTIVTSQEISFYLIKREDLIGLRIKQNSNSRRLNFKGRKWYPINIEFKINANYQLLETPKSIMMPNVLGQTQEIIFDGEILFNWVGHEYRLFGKKGETGTYRLIFNDASSKINTYPSGRFLDTEPIQEDGTLIIDFNKAFNPPCAFSQYATCPLPPKENILPFNISAGELYVPIH